MKVVSGLSHCKRIVDFCDSASSHFIKRCSFMVIYKLSYGCWKQTLGFICFIGVAADQNRLTDSYLMRLSHLRSNHSQGEELSISSWMEYSLKDNDVVYQPSRLLLSIAKCTLKGDGQEVISFSAFASLRRWYSRKLCISWEGIGHFVLNLEQHGKQHAQGQLGIHPSESRAVDWWDPFDVLACKLSSQNRGIEL